MADTSKAFYVSKKQLKKTLRDRIAEMSDLQTLLYASNRYAALLIFQAMDAAGKDSAIKHVMSGVNPQGCQVFSFKQPSQKSWNTIFCGAPPDASQRAAGSVFLIARIMKRS